MRTLNDPQREAMIDAIIARTPDVSGARPLGIAAVAGALAIGASVAFGPLVGVIAILVVISFLIARITEWVFVLVNLQTQALTEARFEVQRAERTTALLDQLEDERVASASRVG